jgi:serine protein kinase
MPWWQKSAGNFTPGTGDRSMSSELHQELSQLVADAGAAQTTDLFSGVFQDFYTRLRQGSGVVQTAHQRLYSAVARHGFEDVDTQSEPRLNRLYGGQRRTIRRWKFFDDEFFGIDPIVMQVMEFLKAAASGGEESRQILYLYGPVGTGKTSMVERLKQALELSGPFYALQGCPIQEDPLRLVPKHIRAGMEKMLGLRPGFIKGWPCPVCQKRLDESFNGDFTRFPVAQLNYSIERQIGVGILPPADENSMDVSLLIGQVDLGLIGKALPSDPGTILSESDPRTILFNGALNRGERGITDLYEMNKNPTPLLHPLISATQEHKYRAPGQHPMLASDTVLIAHSNETELENFMKDKRNEALIDRTVRIHFPYTLEKSAERQIVDKIILREADFRSDAGDKAHIAPGTSEIISIFQVLSRLKPSEKVDLPTKLMLYDGEEIVERSAKSKPVDIKELRAEIEGGEGFNGFSTRFATKAMGRALARTKGGVCVTPVHVMEVLTEEIESSAELEPDRRKYLLEVVLKGHVRKWYLERILREHIGLGFLTAYADVAQNMVDEYLDHVFGWNLKEKVRDRKTDEIEDPKEEVMSAIESAIGVTDTMKAEFRAQVATYIGKVGREESGESRRVITWDSHPRLKEAVKRRMFQSIKGFTRVISRNTVMNDEDRQRYDDMTKKMRDELGYCQHCVDVSLRFAKNHNLFDGTD